jgi:C1A family cysteine protease
MPTGLTSLSLLIVDVAKLRRLGFKTVEEVMAVAASANRELSGYLGRPIDDFFRAAAVPSTFDKSVAGDTFQYPLGAWITPVTARMPPLVALAETDQRPDATATSSLSYISRMHAIKHQGKRNTCVAFASIAVLEFYLTMSDMYQSMSEQFTYYICKQLDGSRNKSGTKMQFAFRGLLANGCCTESDWPYSPDQPPADNEADGPPPPTAVADAQTYREQGYSLPAGPASSSQICDILRGGQCVAFTLPLFPSSYGNPQVKSTGDFVNPVPGERSIGGHALCIVGFQDSPNDSANAGGRFIVRNSWGAGPEDWAPHSTTGTPGYGTISYYYVEQYAEEVYTIPISSSPAVG